jgi:hypothetical protein
MARLLRFAIAAAASAAILLLLTLGAYKLHLWMGDHLNIRDGTLRVLAYFPIIVGLIAGMWPSPRLSRSPFVAGLIGALIGFVYGYCAPRAYLVMFLREDWRWRVLGPMSFDWEIDIAALVCAIVPATCAMLLAVTARSRHVIATVVTLVLAALLVPAPLFDLITHNQELTVAVVIPYTAGGGNEPRVSSHGRSTPVDIGSVTKHVQDLLRDEGVRGNYRVSILWRAGHGKQALAVIVFNQPVVSRVELQQPRGSDLIYLQQPDGWKKIPPQCPTLNRLLSVDPPLSEDDFGFLHTSDVGGYGTIFPISKTPD